MKTRNHNESGLEKENKKILSLFNLVLFVALTETKLMNNKAKIRDVTTVGKGGKRKLIQKKFLTF